jgi:hypothetical protein
VLLLERVEIGEDVGEVLGIHVGLRGHEGMTVEDGCGDAVVVGRRAAGKVLLLEDPKQRRTVQRTGGAVVVALRAAGFENGVSVSLLRVELVERYGRRRGVAAREERRESEEQRAEAQSSDRMHLHSA